MKYYVIAGERSGDLHASNLIKELKNEDANAHFRVLGGEQMEEAGAEIYRYYHEINYMGVWEVIKHLPIILKNLSLCQQDIVKYNPDVIILVDFGGFNMKIAAFAKKHGIKVFYYISPKVWAWNTGRAYKIKKLVDRMFVILPFEKDFFKKFDYEVDYVGNPVNDALLNFVPDVSHAEYLKSFEKPIVAILPGSRKYEVINMFSVIGEVFHKFPNHKFVITAVNSLPKSYYEQFKLKYPEAEIVYEKTYDTLINAQAAVVTSGTASLETALLNVPHVVVFKANWFSWIIGNMVLKIDFVSLPNLIAGYEVVKEYLQSKFTPSMVTEELDRLLHDEQTRTHVFDGYKKIKAILGNAGTSKKTAQLMYQYLQESTSVK